MGGLCGEVHLSLWLHVGRKSYQILPAWWPLDSKTFMPQWVNSDHVTNILWFLLAHRMISSTCLVGMCQRGHVEISEKELNGTCNSTCTFKSYVGPPKHGCTRIHNCRKKETGWKRFFAQCVPCICDCALSCGEYFLYCTLRHMWYLNMFNFFLFWAPACKNDNFLFLASAG